MLVLPLVISRRKEVKAEEIQKADIFSIFRGHLSMFKVMTPHIWNFHQLGKVSGREETSQCEVSSHEK